MFGTETVAHEIRRVRLGGVARYTNVARPSHLGTHLLGGIAIVDVVARGDGSRLTLLLVSHRVALEAGILLLGDGEEVACGVRDTGRSDGIGTRQERLLPRIAVIHLHRRRRRHVEDAPFGEAEARILDGRGRGAATGCELGGQGQDDGGLHGSALAHALVTLTAHFLKSLCLEIGQVASSVTLLMKTPSSNHGTNTSPRGTRLRPV